jgi:hypothetical protein
LKSQSDKKESLSLFFVLTAARDDRIISLSSFAIKKFLGKQNFITLKLMYTVKVNSSLLSELTSTLLVGLPNSSRNNDFLAGWLIAQLCGRRCVCLLKI